MRSAAMVRLLMFAGGGRKELAANARTKLYWFGLTTRSDAARVREVILHAGIPWLATRLAEENPVAIVQTRPTISRLDAMRSEFSSVIVCLRHPAAIANLGAAADLLLERGHAWLGEPLALWLVDDREKAVDILLERVPVLDVYAEWDLEDAFDRADAAARTRVSGGASGVEESPTMRIEITRHDHDDPKKALTKGYWFGTSERDDFYSRLFDYQRRLTRASEP